MNALELSQAIDNFFNQIDESQSFLRAVTIFSDYLEKILPHLEALSAGGSRIAQLGTDIHNLFIGFSDIQTSVNIRRFFQGFDHFKKTVDILKGSWSTKYDRFQKMQDNAEKFADLYGKYLSNKTPIVAYQLIFSARDLQQDIKITFELLASIRSTLIPEEIPNNSESEISIILPEQFNLKNFALRLIALQEIYSELCHLFGISELDNPLRIQKIESGSLWALLFGNTKVTEFMADSIKSTASFVYRNYTKEGKISSIPMKVETIDSLLDLTKRLEDAGINTSEIKPHIEKSALVISKEISKLIEGQYKVTVNGETLSVNAELEKRLIEGLKSPQLTSNNGDD